MKKTKRRILKGNQRRGVGPVIVSAFMVVILLLGFNSFRLILFRATQHGDFIDDIQQADYEKDLESISVLGKPFDEDHNFKLTIVNVGEIESTVTWISVLDYDTKEPIHGYEKLDPPINLKPEETSQIIEPLGGWNFPGAYTYKGDPIYIIQIATNRGTVNNYPYPNPGRKPIKGETGHLIGGPFVFNYDDISFSYTSTMYDTPVPAWEIFDNEDEITFHVTLKNNSGERVTLNEYSYMLVIVPEQPLVNFLETELTFCIIDKDSTPDTIIPYDPADPLYFEPEETKIIKFASKSPHSSSFNDENCLRDSNLQGTENLVTTFLVLFWEYGESGQVLGQTIPFVAIYLPPY